MAEKPYQILQAELDAVLARLQDPEVEVDEAITLYEEGTKLITQLEKHLKKAENKLIKLRQSDSL